MNSDQYRVEEIKETDYDSVIPLLNDLNPNLKDNWHKLFSNPWGPLNLPLGYKLIYSEEVVGYIATIIHKKYKSGKCYYFCNLSSWIVKKEHRGIQSILLIKAVMKNKFLFTNFSPNPSLVKTFLSLKWKILEVNAYILFPKWISKKHYILLYQNIENHITHEESTYLRDHYGLGLINFVIASGFKSIFVIARIKKIFKLRFLQILYITAIPDNIDYLENKLLKLCKSHKVCGIIIDSRFMVKQRHFALKIHYNNPKMIFNSEEIYRPQEINYLYSEYTLLNEN
jgi:hypothetical protein